MNMMLKDLPPVTRDSYGVLERQYGARNYKPFDVVLTRGRGLMIAIELHPQAGGGRRYCDALRLRGLLCKDTHDHTIRVSPPLVITRDEVDWALDQFDAALRQPAAA